MRRSPVDLTVVEWSVQWSVVRLVAVVQHNDSDHSDLSKAFPPVPVSSPPVREISPPDSGLSDEIPVLTEQKEMLG